MGCVTIELKKILENACWILDTGGGCACMYWMLCAVAVSVVAVNGTQSCSRQQLLRKEVRLYDSRDV